MESFSIHNFYYTPPSYVEDTWLEMASIYFWANYNLSTVLAWVYLKIWSSTLL